MYTFIKKSSITNSTCPFPDLYPSCNKLWNGFRPTAEQYSLSDGWYTIDPDGAFGVDPFEVLCDFPLKTIVPVTGKAHICCKCSKVKL